jgi:hypothetical protein
MTFWSKLFNWKAFVRAVADEALAQATVEAQREIDDREGLGDAERVLLNEGVDLLVDRARTELQKRL